MKQGLFGESDSFFCKAKVVSGRGCNLALSFSCAIFASFGLVDCSLPLIPSFFLACDFCALWLGAVAEPLCTLLPTPLGPPCLLTMLCLAFLLMRACPRHFCHGTPSFYGGFWVSTVSVNMPIKLLICGLHAR